MWKKDRLEVTGGSLTGEADEGTPESGADVDTAISSGYTRRILTAAHGSGANAFVGKGVKFKGIISYSGTVRIDGELEGEIQTDGTLLIGEEAHISANISAGTIICSGKITGDVKAVERIKLYSPAVLTGSVDTPAMSMEEGAQLNGHCAMQTTDGRPNLRALGNEVPGSARHPISRLTDKPA